MRKIRSPKSLDLPSVLHALSDPTRLAIVKMLSLSKEERTCCSFLCECNLAKPTLSHHFKVLREAGITRIRVQGTRRMTSLCRQELEKAFPGLLNAILRSARCR